MTVEALRAEADIIKYGAFWETDIEASTAWNSFQETGYGRNRRSGSASTQSGSVSSNELLAELFLALKWEFLE